jgi:hypothetical protein
MGHALTTNATPNDLLSFYQDGKKIVIRGSAAWLACVCPDTPYFDVALFNKLRLSSLMFLESVCCSSSSRVTNPFEEHRKSLLTVLKEIRLDHGCTS